MRHDPIEFGTVAKKVRRRRSARPAARLPIASQGAPATAAIDEAFAGLLDLDSPASPNTAATGDRTMVNQSLVANLAAQLDAFDRQRERLAQLLDQEKGSGSRKGVRTIY